MKTTEDKNGRPLVVTLAVVYLAVAFGAGLVRDIQGAQSFDFRFGCVFAVMLILEAVILWFIFRGKNWARWLWLAILVLGVMSSWPKFILRIHDYSASVIVVRILYLMGELMVLF